MKLPPFPGQYTHVNTCVFTCTQTRPYTHTHFTYMCVCMHTWIYVRVHTYLNTYIHVHTKWPPMHTHMHPYMSPEATHIYRGTHAENTLRIYILLFWCWLPVSSNHGNPLPASPSPGPRNLQDTAVLSLKWNYAQAPDLGTARKSGQSDASHFLMKEISDRLINLWKYQLSVQRTSGVQIELKNNLVTDHPVLSWWELLSTQASMSLRQNVPHTKSDSSQLSGAREPSVSYYRSYPWRLWHRVIALGLRHCGGIGDSRKELG